MRTAKIIYVISVLILIILSFGFIDPNLRVFGGIPELVIGQLMNLVYNHRMVTAVLYTSVILSLFFAYALVLKNRTELETSRIPKYWIWIIGLFLLAFPAFSYDIFNYILTAKVAFLYRENPYVVMPIEIPNEPMLAYTRAANKLALYGPTWIVLSVIPYMIGVKHILLSVFSFKIFAGVMYAVLVRLIFRKSKRRDQVVFFALHPLVLIEVLVSGHNDISMVTLAYAGLILWDRRLLRNKIPGMLLFLSSVFVKGATIVLLPLFFVPHWKWEKKMRLAFWLSLAVFCVTPIREELYSWYAVWWLTPAAFIPLRSKSIVHGLSFWLGLALMLRYIPWIATREYGGMTPVIRIILTVIPLVIYIIRYVRRSGRKSFI